MEQQTVWQTVVLLVFIDFIKAKGLLILKIELLKKHIYDQAVFFIKMNLTKLRQFQQKLHSKGSYSLYDKVIW